MIRSYSRPLGLMLLCAASSCWGQLVNVGPVSVDFGAIKMGATVSIPVTFQNLTVGNVMFAGGGFNNPGAFAADSGSCSSTLAAGASCYFTYSFIPTSASGEQFTASTEVEIFNGTIYQYVPLSFSGSGTESLIQVTPVSIDFGSTFIGEEVTARVTFSNTHSASVSLSGGGISGNAAFTGSSGSCSATVSAGSTCYFLYSFTPSTTGLSQVLTGVGIGALSPVTLYQITPIALTGTGVATLPSPNVDVWPVSVDYGPIKVGHQASLFVDYKNNSPSSVSLAGGGFNDTKGGTFGAFGGAGLGCSNNMVTSGTTCATTYTFLPHVAQTYTDTTNDEFYIPNGSSLFVPLAFSGTGVGTLARVSPQTINLGTVAFGTNVSVPVTITNTSDAALSNFTGGGVNSPFFETSSCGSSVAVGASCTLTYTFYAPSANASFRSSYTASTLIAFTNTTAIEQVTQIQLTVRVGDRIFGDGFEG